MQPVRRSSTKKIKAEQEMLTQSDKLHTRVTAPVRDNEIKIQTNAFAIDMKSMRRLVFLISLFALR